MGQLAAPPKFAAMGVRRLGPGDRDAATRACELYGISGEVKVDVFLQRPETTLLVAEEDGDVVGYAYGHELAHPDGELTMLLYALDVAEAARRRRLGRQLVSTFVEDARQRGCSEVWVLTGPENAPALATYQSAEGRRSHGESVMLTWHLRDGYHSGASDDARRGK